MRVIEHKITTIRTGETRYQSTITVNGVTVAGYADSPLNSFFDCIAKLNDMRSSWHFRCPAPPANATKEGENLFS